MSEAVVDPTEEAPRKRGKLLPVAAAILLGGGGFASTYLGFWSPMGLFAGSSGAPAVTTVSPAVFVEIPRIELSVPGGRGRSLILAVSIETDATHRAEVEHLMPRVLDAFTGFLSGVDPAAYDKRGVLEIIRAELVTRTRYVLGEAPVKDLLITEFLIR
ncbi:MAG: flagellar basal body protein FliL [Paracoccus sp.]|jgi:flagellar protein FliL|nr:MAG: flagellar basal body protein FliL [Paracoccus sp. (in: a-proteobacteria)]